MQSVRKSILRDSFNRDHLLNALRQSLAQSGGSQDDCRGRNRDQFVQAHVSYPSRCSGFDYTRRRGGLKPPSWTNTALHPVTSLLHLRQEADCGAADLSQARQDVSLETVRTAPAPAWKYQ